MTDVNERKAYGVSYSALALAENSIRLIDFTYPPLHGSKEVDGPLRCSVKVYSLDDRTGSYQELVQKPADGSTDWHLQHLLAWDPHDRSFAHRFQWGDWIALSHCWGDRNATERIYVNDEPCEISTTMAAGLRAVSQLSAVRTGELKLWHDFLCLDQQNKNEIERELKRVPDIYGNAFAVVAWVGPASDDSSLVIELFRTKLQTSGVVCDSSDLMLKSISPVEWRALASFLHRPYWRRQWMVQELTLAGGRTVMLCGRDSAPLTQLWELIKAIIRNTALVHRLIGDAFGTSDRYYDPVRHHIFSVVPRLLYLHDVNHGRLTESESDFNLLPLLDVCRDSQQQYLRDKVYGILGLLPPNVTSLIEPDLHKEPHQIYSDLVLASIRGLNSLDVLQNCTYGAWNPVFPTWTPDLTADSMAHTLTTRATTNAGGPLLSQPHLSSDNLTLTCRGYIIDKISHLTPPQWPLHPISPAETADALPPNPIPHQTHATTRSALWQVLFGGSAGWPHTHAPPEEYAQILDLAWPPRYDDMEPSAIAADLIADNWVTVDEKQDLITFVTFRQRAGRAFDLAGCALGDFFPTDSTSTSFSKSVADDNTDPNSGREYRWANRAMLRQACYVLKRRRLLVTAQGRLGICGRQARPGDVVVVLRGCSAPLVLRRFEGGGGGGGEEGCGDEGGRGSADARQKFVVVGACYVHGLTRFGEWYEDGRGRGAELVEGDVVLV